MVNMLNMLVKIACSSSLIIWKRLLFKYIHGRQISRLACTPAEPPRNSEFIIWKINVICVHALLILQMGSHEKSTLITTIYLDCTAALPAPHAIETCAYRVTQFQYIFIIIVVTTTTTLYTRLAIEKIGNWHQ